MILASKVGYANPYGFNLIALELQGFGEDFFSRLARFPSFHSFSSPSGKHTLIFPS